MIRSRSFTALLGVSAAAASLAGCKVDNRPVLAWVRPDLYEAAAPPPGPLEPGYAQPVAYLPPAQAYAYPARAYRVSRAYYDRPPSYAFAYEGEQPWVWQAGDADWMFVEPYDEGYRYYYYEPGEAYPYYIQDADYGYAYDDSGALIALFTAAGALLSASVYDDYHDRAYGYWNRGYALESAYWSSPRYVVDDAIWRERAPILTGRRDRWVQAFSAQPAWREAIARGDYALPHDNGRHLGWYKNRGPSGREAVVASQEPFAPNDLRGQDQGRGGWKHGGGYAQSEPQRGQGAPLRGPDQGQQGGGERGGRGGWKHGGGYAQAEPQRGQGAAIRGPDQGQQGGGERGGRGGWKHGGGYAQAEPQRGQGAAIRGPDQGQQGGGEHGGRGGWKHSGGYAQAAPQRGQDAAFRGPERAQPQGGGDHGHGPDKGGQGGGGPHGGGKGGDNGDKGRGHGKP
jgi:hypothetical protein